MTTASWGPEKGSTASEKTDGLCRREMNRGGCANMWVSPQSFLTHSRILFSSEYFYYKIFIHEKCLEN